MEATGLSDEQVRKAVADLDGLTRREYGYGLDELLADPDRTLAELRLKRLTGILLKRRFGRPQKIGASPTATGSRRAWRWTVAKFDDPGLAGTPEYGLLDELRRDLGRQRGDPSSAEDPSFAELVDEAEHERGLFKVLALWLDDRLQKREARSLKEYLEAAESARFEAALDTSNLLAGAALAPLFALVPVPAVVISLVLIGVKFGYRSITDAEYRGDREL